MACINQDQTLSVHAGVSVRELAICAKVAHYSMNLSIVIEQSPSFIRWIASIQLGASPEDQTKPLGKV